MNSHIAAVYGSLKRGLKHHFLMRCESLLREFQTQSGFIMLNLIHYTRIYKVGNTAISLELFKVDNQTLEALDELEEVPDLYLRLNYLAQEFGDAWIYLLSENYLKQIGHKRYAIVDSGCWQIKN